MSPTFPDEEPPGHTFEILTPDGGEEILYEFVADGPVEQWRTGDDVWAGGNDPVTERPNGMYHVEGKTGNGFGDAFKIDGTIVSWSDNGAERTLRWDGTEVTVDELVSGDTGTGTGDPKPGLRAGLQEDEVREIVATEIEDALADYDDGSDTDVDAKIEAAFADHRDEYHTDDGSDGENGDGDTGDGSDGDDGTAAFTEDEIRALANEEANTVVANHVDADHDAVIELPDGLDREQFDKVSFVDTEGVRIFEVMDGTDADTTE